ncbi:MAG TPA: winged helix DNA-binding domain-containing protein [Candidatus Limnocylindria bacterium]|nr:winged helix DNA-binding domain-containing protein [Candidatus Limnocylindria bacterium]
MTVRVTWKQALAWRMERQLLDPVGRLPVAGVVRRLCAVQTQVASSAELAIRVRRRSSRRGEVARALAEGTLIKTWAMRGTLHLITPEEGGAFLSLLAAGRIWERPSWQRYFGLTPALMELFRETVRDALGDKTLSREEIIAAVIRRPKVRHLGEELRSGWGTLFKPLAWQGDLCFGPSRGNRVTFRRPDVASARWAGVPGPDEAAMIAMRAYVAAYGPTTARGFGHWLAAGWSPTRQLTRWFAGLGDRLAEVEVDGERAYVLAKDVDALAAARPSATVRLLPGFDQYVLGPMTSDAHVIAPKRRSAVSRQSGWIAPVVLAGGVVAGTWEIDGDDARIAWFTESGRPPRRALEAEVERLASLLDRDLGTTISLA